MRHHRLITISSVIATLASIMLATSAAAETTLLAEWLLNGSIVTTNQSFEEGKTVGIENSKTIIGRSGVLCSFVLVGTFGPNGSGEITELLNLAGFTIGTLGGLALLGTGSSSDCATNTGCAEGSMTSPIEVWPVGLPWKLQLFLMENGSILLLTFATSLGWMLLCLVLGVNAEDTCTTSDNEYQLVNSPVTGDVTPPDGTFVAPKYHCTQSNEETGEEETIGEAPILPTGGQLLTEASE